MLENFIDIAKREGLPLDLVVDHVGQAVFDVYGINYGDDESWALTDKISEAIEQCYDINSEHQEHLNDDERGEPKWTF